MEISLLAIFDEIWAKTLYYSPWSLPKFLSNFKKFTKNPNLIGITSNFLCNIRTCICIRKKIIKMEIFLLAIFDENWPKTLYYSPWSLPKFLSNFKNSQKIRI